MGRNCLGWAGVVCPHVHTSLALSKCLHHFGMKWSYRHLSILIFLCSNIFVSLVISHFAFAKCIVMGMTPIQWDLIALTVRHHPILFSCNATITPAQLMLALVLMIK